MHGLVNRSIQCFVRDAHGAAKWIEIVGETASGIPDYEALCTYPDEETEDLLRVVCARLGKPRARLLEDIGTWLVTSDAPVRRLLRFGGTDFVEFLHSLDELPGRARLAVAGLEFPALELREHAPFAYTVTLSAGFPGFGSVLQGVLQAMADDYGALCLFELLERPSGVSILQIKLFKTDYAAGKAFDLTAGPA